MEPPRDSEGSGSTSVCLSPRRQACSAALKPARSGRRGYVPTEPPRGRRGSGSISRDRAVVQVDELHLVGMRFGPRRRPSKRAATRPETSEKEGGNSDATHRTGPQTNVGRRIRPAGRGLTVATAAATRPAAAVAHNADRLKARESRACRGVSRPRYGVATTVPPRWIGNATRDHSVR
jgi:hypothetical protein